MDCGVDYFIASSYGFKDVLKNNVNSTHGRQNGEEEYPPESKNCY